MSLGFVVALRLLTIMLLRVIVPAPVLQFHLTLALVHSRTKIALLCGTVSVQCSVTGVPKSSSHCAGRGYERHGPVGQSWLALQFDMQFFQS